MQPQNPHLCWIQIDVEAVQDAELRRLKGRQRKGSRAGQPHEQSGAQALARAAADVHLEPGVERPHVRLTSMENPPHVYMPQPVTK